MGKQETNLTFVTLMESHIKIEHIRIMAVKYLD